MKIVFISVFALALLLPTSSRAQQEPVAVPGTADTAGVNVPFQPFAEKPVERQITDAEKAKVPLSPIFPMSDRDAEGNGVMITSASIHVEDGQPVWYIGAVGRCLRGVIATPKQQAEVRAYLAKYTNAEVRFEKGRFASSSPVNLGGCK
jgi:hypothetical protein